MAQAGPEIPTPRFVHPGIPLTIDDLSKVRAMIKAGKEPWYGGYQALLQDHHSSLRYKMQGPAREVDRNLGGTGRDVNLNQWRHDMRAIGNQARMWYYTGDARYAQSAHDMLLKWATTQEVFGGYEAVLDMGDYVHDFVTGADILRGTWPGWTASDTTTVKAFFRKVYYPATGILGNQNSVGPANKGAYALLDAVYLTLFNDDKEGYDKAITDLFQAGPSGMLNTLSTGQIGESLRDSGHAFDEWYSLARLAEASWSQGIDLYSVLSDRLLAVGEYHARLGFYAPYLYEAPSIPYGTTDIYYLHLPEAPYAATRIRTAVNLLRGAYKMRLGRPTPWLDQATLYAPEDSLSFSFEKVADTSTATPVLYSYPSVKSVSIGLSDADLGDANQMSGSSTYRLGHWAVTGAGSRIFVDPKINPQIHADNYHFAYLPITGDGTFIAKVDAPPVGGSTSAIAGIVVRDNLAGVPTVSGVVGLSSVQRGRVYAQTLIHGWNGMRGGTNFQMHYYNGKCFSVSCTPLPPNATTEGYWVKIDRLGHWLNLSISPDGTSWATVDSGYFNAFPTKLYYGLLVASGADGARIAARFSHVAATGGDGLGAIKAPLAPLNTVTGLAGNRVTVRWLSSEGAASYTLKRAMSPSGPFTAIASGVKGTSYVDQGLVRHGTYYYTVSAANIAGESANSPPDSVQY